MKLTFLFLISFFIPKAVSKAIINKECFYIADPVYIKTTVCGGFCAGVTKCKNKHNELSYTASVVCQAVEDDCPEAKTCFRVEKIGKVRFTGTPAEYREQNKEEDKNNQASDSLKNKHSGAIK